MRLTIIPPVLKGETAAAHLLRAFDINGEPWSRERLRTAGHTLSDILQGRTAKPFLDFLGRDDDMVRRWTPAEVTKRGVTLGGEKLHRDDWTTSERRWCPCCWEDDLRAPPSGRHLHWNIYRRFWWDVAVVKTCPIHCTRLATTCMTCGTDVTWEAGSLTRCRNGHSLLTCKGISIAGRETLADAYVVGRLGGMPRVDVPILDGLTLDEACDTMERLGVALLGGATGALSKFPSERHAEIHSAGFEIARDWPDAFNALLDKLARADHVGLGAWGAEQVYGYLYLWAKRLPVGFSGNAIRAALFTHSAARGPVHKTSVVNRQAVQPLLSLSDLATRCGRSPQIAAGYLKALGAWPKRTKRGTPLAITQEVADEICAIHARIVRADELPAMIGLAKRQIYMLVSARIILPAEIHRRSGVKTDVFDRDEITAVLDRLRGTAPIVDVTPIELLPLARASKFARVDGVRGSAAMILAGHLKVKAVLRDAPGFAGLLVDPQDIRIARRAQAGGGLTLEQVGRRIKVPTDNIGRIVRKGLLRGVMSPCGEILVKEDALAAFEATYATTGALAREIGTGIRWMREALDQAGIEPVFETRARKTTAVWCRSKVLSDLQRRMQKSQALQS